MQCVATVHSIKILNSNSQMTNTIQNCGNFILSWWLYTVTLTILIRIFQESHHTFATNFKPNEWPSGHIFSHLEFWIDFTELCKQRPDLISSLWRKVFWCNSVKLSTVWFVVKLQFNLYAVQQEVKFEFSNLAMRENDFT